MPNRFPRGFAALAVLSLAGGVLHGQGRPRGEQSAAIDSIALVPITAGRVAGMSLAVVRGADTITLKGYGSADLELDVPTPPGAVYEIGSVTKQFTAAAVFQLAARNVLSLDDGITKFLPDYPTQGHRITIRSLLNHTSGIKGYTELPRFWTAIAMRDLPRDSLVAMFSAEPFDFAPGDMMIYNNSAYFLLGLIIEKASGESYETYVKRHLFDPLGMRATHYCTNDLIVKNRAKGYAFGGQGLARAPYLSHRWPYAAGSICSTAGDLLIWNHALHGPRGVGGTLLAASAYRAFLTPDTLNDGTRLRYAHGLSITETGGRRRMSHGGGIYGYLSESRYYPDADLIIVVLINTAGPVNPAAVADAIEEVVLGKPPSPPERRFAGDLSRFVGTYEGPGRGQRFTLTVSVDSATLAFKIGPGQARRVRYVDGLTFAQGDALFTFVQRGDEIVELRYDQVAGYLKLVRTAR
jgi:CubicO group peptidase (beta-lactamase class C family)